MSNLLILGAGGHGKVVADIALLMGRWDNIAFLDDRKDLQNVAGISVIGKLEHYDRLRSCYQCAFVAIGDNKARIKWMERLYSSGYVIPSLIHPRSVISQTSCIGPGSVVMAGSVINACSVIGKGCIINTGATIDHDNVIEDGVHISPGVHIAGSVSIGQNTWLCIGSCVINNIKIGRNSIIAAGTTVISDVSDSVLVAGVPAKVKRVLE